LQGTNFKKLSMRYSSWNNNKKDNNDESRFKSSVGFSKASSQGFSFENNLQYRYFSGFDNVPEVMICESIKQKQSSSVSDTATELPVYPLTEQKHTLRKSFQKKNAGYILKILMTGDSQECRLTLNKPNWKRQNGNLPNSNPSAVTMQLGDALGFLTVKHTKIQNLFDKYSI